MNHLEKKTSWKIFDQISTSYDKINRIVSFGKDQSWRKKIASFLPQRQDLHILDIATGTGDQLFCLLDQKSSIASAIGIDLSQEMLELAKKKSAAKDYKEKIKWLHANAESLPFKEASFDAITFSFGIRNVENPLKALQEVYRVLKPKGKCFILEFSLPPKPIRFFYLLYLRHILPYVAGSLAKNVPAYRYLNQTIETFPFGKSFCDIMRQAGFQKIKQHPLALGAVSLYIGEKIC